MKLHPLRSEADYDDALREIDRLLDVKPGTEAFDRLEMVSILVEAYEREHHPIGPPDPIAAIELVMEQRDLTRKDLERFIGSRGRVAEVLNRKRPLSIEMIRALHRGLEIPAEVLIQETTRKTRSATKTRSRAGRAPKAATTTARRAVG